MGFANDIKKTLAYARRNGIAAAVAAARERIALNRIPYTYEELSAETLREQRADFSRLVRDAGVDNLPQFSIVVPAYKTRISHLTQMIGSVKRQTYGAWELIIADASPDAQRLEHTVVDTAADARVRYLRLAQNRGIAANTNEAVQVAGGDYIVLLDHDDLLTQDALYEIARAVLSAETPPVMVYSDEDKFSEKAQEDKENKPLRQYFEPHRKESFDFERLLSNNYVCHLLAIRSDIARRYPMDASYDGAQDHELCLRIAADLVFAADRQEGTPARLKEKIVHVPRVLYHWRAHEASTAADPSHKDYAFDAGKRAIADVMQKKGIRVTVSDLPHLGFYRADYPDGIFAERKDIGVVGGKITDRDGVTLSGRMDEAGNVYYEGMQKGESGGYQHNAVLVLEAEAVDLRVVKVRDELLTLYAQYADGFDENDEQAVKEKSLAFCKAVTATGYRILYDPQFVLCKERIAAVQNETTDLPEISETSETPEISGTPGTEEEDGQTGDGHHSQL